MRLDVTGRHVEITAPLRQLITRRLAKLERLLNDHVISAHAILSKEKYRHRTELVIHARGDHMMRGLGEGNNWPLSVRQAAEKIEQQAQTLKSKWTERKGRRERALSRGEGRAARAAAPPPAAVARTAEAEPESGRRVVRAMRYPVKPMTVEDAAARVEEARDGFVVFRNADTNAVSILYLRKDGQLGLIEPD